MAGCYGNDPEDRYWENRLINHLDKQEENPCEMCGFKEAQYEFNDEYFCEDCIKVREEDELIQ